jgi:UPF0042 nucleotide-binding protein
VEVLLVTGLSGAGKSEAVKVLEDLGWFVVDNLPPSFMGKFVELAERGEPDLARVAMVADARGFPEELEAAIVDLEGRRISVRTLFLDASDDVLIRRYEGSRRRHPLGEFVSAGIAQERDMLEALKERADVIVDTSDLNVHQLRSRLVDLFGGADQATALQVSLVSFGFKHGLPLDADMVFDVRFLPNPHWVDDLRPLPGTDPRVRDYVLGQPATRAFMAKVTDLVCSLLPLFVDEGKAYLTIAFGCTGGRHRSVVLADTMGSSIQAEGYPVIVRHRDLEK